MRMFTKKERDVLLPLITGEIALLNLDIMGGGKNKPLSYLIEEKEALVSVKKKIASLYYLAEDS